MIIAASRIITGDGKTVLDGYGVLTGGKKGQILKVAPLQELTTSYPDEKVCHYDDASLLPGLIDLHTHLGAWEDRPNDFRNNDYLFTCVTLNNLHSILKDGVTTVRDVGSPDMISASIISAHKMGVVPFAIPRVIPCGRGICMTGGHIDDPLGDEAVDGPWAIRQVIRRKVKQGAKWIKVLTSYREPIPEFTQEELDAAVDEAHRRGIRLAVHSGMENTIQMCIDAGFDTIEHGNFMTKEQAVQMQKKGISWTPTLYVYQDAYESAKKTVEEMGEEVTDEALAAAARYKRMMEIPQKNFMDLYSTGVIVGAGTDVPLDKGSGSPVSKEVAIMVKCGLDPLLAIQVGTQNGAKILDLGDVCGTIREGLAADLLIVKGDPSKDIEDLQNVLAVYTGGELAYSVLEPVGVKF